MIRFIDILKETPNVGKELFADLEKYRDSDEDNNLFFPDYAEYVEDYLNEPEKDTKFEKDALSKIFNYIVANQASDNAKFTSILTKLRSLRDMYPHILKPVKSKYLYRGRSNFSLQEILSNLTQIDINSMQYHFVVKVPITIPVRRGFNSFSTSFGTAVQFEDVESGAGGGATLQLIPPLFQNAFLSKVEKEYPYYSLDNILLDTYLTFDGNLAGIAVVKGDNPNFVLNPNFMNSLSGDYNEDEVLYVGDEYTTVFVAFTKKGYKPLSIEEIANQIFLQGKSKDPDKVLQEVQAAFDSIKSYKGDDGYRVRNLNTFLFHLKR